MITLDSIREHGGTLGMLGFAFWLFILVTLEMFAKPSQPVTSAPVSAIVTGSQSKTETGDEETGAASETELGCLVIEGVKICDEAGE